MKKSLIPLAAAVLLLVNSSIAQIMKQDTSSIENTNELVCKLTGEEFQKRKAKLQEEVFAKVQKVEEVENGYIFYFQYDEGHLVRLMDYMLAENKCCPFFQQDLTLLPNEEGVVWKLSGNEQVKELLDTMSEVWN